jgi:hypothetical protein
MKKTEVLGIPYPDKGDIAQDAPLHMQAIAEKTEQLLLMMEHRIKELEQQVAELKGNI